MRRTVLLFVLGACSSHDTVVDAPVPCPIGDPTQPAQLEIMNLDENMQPMMTGSDARIPLKQPPQGGFVVYLGARATNIDGCQVSITTSFRDLCSPTIVEVDVRPTHLDDTGDGWAVTQVDKYGNLPMCPVASAKHDLHDLPYEISVQLKDVNGQKATASTIVTPYCLNPDPTGICLCTCDHNYVLGGACPPAGADAGMACPAPNPREHAD